MEINIFETVYGILFHPVETFRNVFSDKPYKFPLGVVLFSALFLTMLGNDAFGVGFLGVFFSKAVGLIVYWLFYAFFIDLMARMFNIKGRYSKLLTLMSFSFIPWMFLAPLKLLKGFSEWTSVIAVLLLLGVWLWTIALQMLAVSETYEIPRKNAIIILLIPYLGTILYFIWVFDFFIKLSQVAGL